MKDHIQVEVLFNASKEKLWSAITDIHEMKKWYFENIPDFEPKVGFKTKFEIGSNEQIFTATWEVLEVLKNERIKYSWSYDEYDGIGITDFLLSEIGHKTLLTLTNEGIETFPQDIPAFTKESCLAGWEYFLKERLKHYMIIQK
ncbi:MAG: SRPBCC domain-containing protein [Flavobacteriaceae bacterium]